MTIRHIVTWKMASTDAVERDTHAAGVATRLESLPAVIPEILSFEVGRNVLKGDNFDVVLVSEFADPAALQRYVAHPAHQEVAAYIRSVVGARAAIDVEL